MVEGDFCQLDLLQGLLINLACDLRLDKPRRPKLWSAEGGKDKNKPDWGPDEMRALAGTYYLSSSSSIILQKTRQFFYTPYITACCEHLASWNEYSMDKYLPYMITVQTLIEGVEDLVNNTLSTNNGLHFFSGCQEISQKCTEIKEALPFPLSESPPLLLQIHILELLLSQSSPRGTSFGLDKFNNQFEHESSLIDWLSASMSAARSLISVILVMPQGEEVYMSNMGWIMMNCGLNLAVRLDLVAARGSISGSMQHLRRFLDMRHTLRQLVLRFEATPGQDAPADHPFYALAKRIRRLENWYLSQAEHQTPDSSVSISPSVNDQSLLGVSTDASGMSVGSMPFIASPWPMSSDWYQNPDLDIGTFLFADPVEFPINLGYGT
ncbi:cercosporin resistance protein [Fusarium globosum]|uniref:Cercosporin resistance protein n=1 Tax=Fusarium globosum TaxID=78864 RepID=A0A8H6D819_9HYPO|nr:cercosporin resistance protein [Fusarium globosum]